MTVVRDSNYFVLGLISILNLISLKIIQIASLHRRRGILFFISRLDIDRTAL